MVSGPADIGEYLIEDGSPVNGTVGGYAERYIHSAIMKAYPDINAVVHSHAEDVLPYTVLDSISLEPVYHMAGFLSRVLFPLCLQSLISTGQQVPNWDIESAYTANDPRDMLVNTPDLGDALAVTFGVNTTHPTSPLHRTVLQRGHGFVTVGSSVEQVTDYAYYTASNARVQTRALLLNNAARGGGVRYLSEQERKGTADMNAWIVYKPWGQWVREVEQSGRFVNELGSPPDLRGEPFD